MGSQCRASCGGRMVAAAVTQRTAGGAASSGNVWGRTGRTPRAGAEAARSPRHAATPGGQLGRPRSRAASGPRADFRSLGERRRKLPLERPDPG